MSYAGQRICYDADSHILETLDWVSRHADPAIRDRLPPLKLGAAGRATETFINDQVARVQDPGRTAAINSNVVQGPKGWQAFGAFDAATFAASEEATSGPISWEPQRGCSFDAGRPVSYVPIEMCSAPW